MFDAGAAQSAPAGSTAEVGSILTLSNDLVNLIALLSRNNFTYFGLAVFLAERNHDLSPNYSRYE